MVFKFIDCTTIITFNFRPFSSTHDPVPVSCHFPFSPNPQPSATTNLLPLDLLTVATALLFAFHTSVIITYVDFCDWLVSLSKCL